MSASILYSSGNVTAYSDERVKTNWKTFGADFVVNLALVKSGTYDRTDQELTQVGVSAQSLRPLMPHAISEDENSKLSVAYGHAAMVSTVELAKEAMSMRKLLAEQQAIIETQNE